MTTPHEPDYTALFKAYLIEPKDNLRAKLIQAVSYHEGWEESAVCMVDEAIMPVFTALLSDSATVERVAERIWAKDYPKGGSIWTNRDGEHVSIATTRLADTPFIAAAPTMMQIINQLQAKLQIAEGALEHYERGTNYETAQAALAQIRGK